MVTIGGVEYPDTMRFIVPWAASLFRELLDKYDENIPVSVQLDIAEWLENYEKSYEQRPT